MINVADLPCLREHFERVALAEDVEAKTEAPEMQYARAPDGPGYRSDSRPPAVQRSRR
jgi:hypothetical protein